MCIRSTNNSILCWFFIFKNTIIVHVLGIIKEKINIDIRQLTYIRSIRAELDNCIEINLCSWSSRKFTLKYQKKYLIAPCHLHVLKQCLIHQPSNYCRKSTLIPFMITYKNFSNPEFSFHVHISTFYDLQNISKMYDFYQCYLISYVTITNEQNEKQSLQYINLLFSNAKKYVVLISTGFV